jgi:hypothetical protein
VDEYTADGLLVVQDCRLRPVSSEVSLAAAPVTCCHDDIGGLSGAFDRWSLSSRPRAVYGGCAGRDRSPPKLEPDEAIKKANVVCAKLPRRVREFLTAGTIMDRISPDPTAFSGHFCRIPIIYQ